MKFIQFLDPLKIDLEKEDLHTSDEVVASVIGNKTESLDEGWTSIQSDQQLSTQSTLFASVQITDADASILSESTTQAIDIPKPKKQDWWPIPSMF